MSFSLGLENRGVIVTGAAGGIGHAVAAAFADAGARVALIDLDRGRCEQVAAELAQPDQHLALGADLTEIDGHTRVVDQVLERFGRLDALVHLAAVLRRRATIEDVSEQDWDAQLDTNVKATFFLNRAVAAAFRRQGDGGRIINFTSQGWLTGGYGGSVVYAASKGAIVSLAAGWPNACPRRDHRQHGRPGRGRHGDDAQRIKRRGPGRFVAMIPLGRLAQPDELTGIVLLLASDHARYITGATINVSGGQIMY